MRYSDDKTGSKLIFLAIVVIVLYLAAFHFDIGAAYRYTAVQLAELFGSL